MADATGIEPDEWELWRAFLAAQGQLMREIDRQLQRDSGIGQGEYGVMAAILEAPRRRMRIGELAEALAWEKSRVSHLVTRMEKRGLLTREGADDDGRASWIGLTPEGRRTILGAVRGHAAQLRRTFFAAIPERDRPALRRTFQRILDGMN